MAQSSDQTSSVPFGALLVAASLILAVTVATTGAARQNAGTEPTSAQQPPAASQTPPTPQEEEEFARAGEAMTERICATACHTSEKVYTKRRTARDWADVITQMAGRGAPATDEQFATVKRYLTRYFAIVSVNSAPAEELSAVLGLSPKDARAIVEYRKVHGNFADIAALLKVEGIDKARIEADPDALIFK
jgi:competence protein ComEA